MGDGWLKTVSWQGRGRCATDRNSSPDRLKRRAVCWPGTMQPATDDLLTKCALGCVKLRFLCLCCELTLPALLVAATAAAQVTLAAAVDLRDHSTPISQCITNYPTAVKVIDAFPQLHAAPVSHRVLGTYHRSLHPAG